MLSVRKIYSWLVLFAIVSFGTAGYAASSSGDYFSVQPTVAAPGQFVRFNWNVNSGSGFYVTPPLNAEADEDGYALPSNAVNYIYVVPSASTTYTGVAAG